MHWIKLKHIFSTNDNYSWMKSHAAVPFVISKDGPVITIGFTSRNEEGKSFLASINLHLDTLETSNLSNQPLLTPGPNGFFDYDGVMPCQSLVIDNSTYLYYIGWNLGVSVPFRNAIGIAKEENGTFKRLFDGPVLDRSIHDPCFVASCCVTRHKEKYLMYYLSCIRWQIENEKPIHHYHIKIASSTDGFSWQPTGKVAIDFQYPNEYAISVPRVIFENETYKMWYSYRGGPAAETYRIGYAESTNGFEWKRKDELVGINVSKEGWDSEMICYPYIFDHDDRRYMLYNGNGYGKTGFGLAVLEN